jgi:hypothetical protein
MIRTFVEFVLGNFTLTFFVVGLLFSGVAIARAPKPVGRAAVIEKLMSWFVFWTIGVPYFYNAIFHIFFGRLAAHFIGWADSGVVRAGLGPARRLVWKASAYAMTPTGAAHLPFPKTHSPPTPAIVKMPRNGHRWSELNRLFV